MWSPDVPSARFLMLVILLLALDPLPTEAADSATGAAIPLFFSLDGEEVAGASIPGSSDVRVAQISTTALASAPERLQLSLIGGASVTASKRPDVSVDPVTTSLASEAAAATTAATSQGQATIAFSADSTNLYAGVPVWVGDVEGQPHPGTGAVVLVMQPDGTTYGSVRYIDPKTKKMRTFRIEPAGSIATATASPGSPSSSPHTIKEVLETRNPRRQRVRIPAGINPNDPKLVARWDLALAARLGNGSAPTLPAPGDNKQPAVGAASVNETLTATEGGPVASPVSSPLPSPGPDAAAAVVTGIDGEAGSTAPTIDAPATAAGLVDEPAAAYPVYQLHNTQQSSAAGVTEDVGGRRKLQQTRVVQDQLAVYTSAAASALGGATAMENEIRRQVASANKAYADSGISLEVRLVAIRLVSGWSESGKTQSTCLSDLQAGRIPNVITWKTEVGADLVTLWANAPRECGVGYVMGQSAFSSAYAFSVVSGDCLKDSYTMSHELGHNQGCDHNSGTDRLGWRTYSYGWRRCDIGSNNFKSIMSYPCMANGAYVYTPEAGLFSTPLRSVNRNGQLYAAGTSGTADCARSIAESAATVAAFTPTKVVPQTSSEIRTRQNTALCIDASSYNNGAAIYLYGCHGGNNQKWEQTSDGTVRVPGTNKCLDVVGVSTANGAKTHVWDCVGGLNQRWFYDRLGRLHPYHAPDKCLDVPNGQATQGNQLHIWDCADVNWQKWNMAPVSFPVFAPNNQNIKSRLNNMCLDVYAFNYNNGGAVVMWPCNTQNNQRWVLDARGQLRSTHNTNKCLDASANTNGATVYIFDCHTGRNQRWFMDGMGRLRPFSDINKCLDIRGGNTAQQTPVQLWDCVDVPQQKWYL